MSWLAPITAIVAAAAVIPLLVLLYFLKLRRQQMLISSTLLWKRAIQDLQVNAPFQRLRRNILLLLQLLVLIAALIALARPVLSLSSGPPKRYVLLIDRSASMNATDISPSRLEEAKKQARQLVQSMRTRATLSLQDQSDQAMVVAFDEHAKVMCNFTTDRKQLESAIDAVQPTDGISSLAEAVAVARAFAQSPGEEANNRSSEKPAQLEIFSDGRIGDAEQITALAGEVAFHCIGKSARNVAVVAMQARRSYEKPDEAEIFATLANYGERSETCDVQLGMDGNVRSVKAVTIPPYRSAAGKDPGGPGLVSVSFSIVHPQASVVEVRQMSRDDLPADDAAWAILPAPKSLTALLVTAGNPALQSALKACPLARLDVATPAEFDAMDHVALSANPKYDVIVLDGHSPAKLPRGRFIVFGPPPQASGVSTNGELTNQVVVDWRSRHPVLQFVNLTNLYVAKSLKMALPPDAAVLAEFNVGPAMAMVRRQGSLFLLVPFDPMETNWPFEPSFVMFCYNATSYLGLEVAQDQQSSLRVNQSITVDNVPPASKAKVVGPGIDADLTADTSGAVRFPGASRAGVYSITLKDRPPARYAVNLLDAAESRIEPARSLSLSGQSVAAQYGVSRGNMEAWPWFVLGALALVCLEWLVYNLKIRL